MSQGKSLPCDDRQRTPINTIYQTAEDGLNDTIKPRLVEADADCNRVMVIDESEKSLTMLDERLEQAIIRTHARVIILDPIQAYIGGDVNMNSANETRFVMSRLGVLAEKYNCAIILIGHMNKGNGKSSYRGLGSIDFQAVARSVLIVGRVKDNPELRVIAHGKSSLAPEGDSIGFELNRLTGFNFIGKVDISVDELLNGKSVENKSDIVEEFLKEILANGSVAQGEIMEKSSRTWSVEKGGG